MALIVILDTNVWMRNLYFRSPASASVHLYLRRKGAKVGLPEVVRLEVEAHLRSDLRKSRDRIKSDHDRLLALFRTLRAVDLPSDEQIEALVGGFFESSGFEFVDIPFTLRSARDSFVRTIEKRPPSEGPQQFKDGVIWADCITLAASDEVVLVSGDQDFYEARSASKGMARALAAEAASCAFPIRLLPNLAALLDAVREPIQSESTLLIEAIEARLQPDIESLLSSAGFSRGSPAVEAKHFASETPNLIYIQFEIAYPCEDVLGEGRTDARLLARGECGWNIATDTIDQVRPFELGISFLDARSEPTSKRNAYLYAEGITLGHREVTRTFREPLD